MKMTANGFTLDLPDDWEDRSMITLVGTTGASGFAANVVITREDVPAGTSIETYAAMQRDAMQDEVDNLEILDERPTRVAAAPAFQRLHRFRIDEDEIQQVQTFILAPDNTIFVVTGTAAISDFDQSLPAFRRVVETFQLS